MGLGIFGAFLGPKYDHGSWLRSSVGGCDAVGLGTDPDKWLAEFLRKVQCPKVRETPKIYGYMANLMNLHIRSG